jgi:hypothetical protein
MKKIIIIFIGGLLISCNTDKEVDIQYQVSANIDVSGMTKGVKYGGNLADLITEEKDDYRATVNYLIYDEAGELVYKGEEERISFFQKITYTATLKEGNYTLVSWVWTCVPENNGIITSWESVNEESLNSLKIKTNVYPFGMPLLGVSKKQIYVNKLSSIDIAVESVGGFFSLNFYHSPEIRENVKSVKLLIVEQNGEYLVNDEVSTIVVPNNGLSYELELTSGSEANEMDAVPFFFFPTKQLLITWYALDESGNIINMNGTAFHMFGISIEKGKNQVIAINLIDGSLTGVFTT